MVKVTITGPGSCINIELYLIKKLLESEGYNVSVVNDHPEDENRFTEAELIRLKNLRDESPEHYTAKIIMEHEPWGG